jgi:hypothetical protein
MMRAKKRPTPKSKIAIGTYAAQRLTMQYAELVRLRQAVRQALNCWPKGLSRVLTTYAATVSIRKIIKSFSRLKVSS